MILTVIVGVAALIVGGVLGYLVFRYVIKGIYQKMVDEANEKAEQLKKENEELYAMVDQKEAEVKQLKAQLAQAQNDYNSLKMARMLEVTDGDLEGVKARVAKMIREVDKAIKLLSAE